MTLDNPAAVMLRLQEIENDLAVRQNSYETAAGAWYAAQREIKKAYAIALLRSDRPTVAEKKAEADLAAYAVEGSEHEAEYHALKTVVGVLEERATIGMSLLKSQGRV